MALIFGGMYVGRRNQMVTKNEAVKAQWAQVDVVLQRRADLIPNLVETVKGFAAQEQTVFGDIAKARAALLGAQTPADRIAANGQLDGALGRLLAIAENYPQLNSNENFLQLQDELAGTENRIAVERRRYNDDVAGLQHLHRAFPEQHCGVAGPASRATRHISMPRSRRAKRPRWNSPRPPISRRLNRPISRRSPIAALSVLIRWCDTAQPAPAVVRLTLPGPSDTLNQSVARDVFVDRFSPGGRTALRRPLWTTALPMRRTVEIAGQVENLFGTLDENLKLLESSLHVATYLAR